MAWLMPGGATTATGDIFNFYSYDNGTATTNHYAYCTYLDESTVCTGHRFITRTYTEFRFLIEGTVPIGVCVTHEVMRVPITLEATGEPRIPEVREERPVPIPPKPDPEREISAQKARALLLEHLDEDNKKRYIDKKPIEIASKIFNGVKYNIPISKTERIKALKEDNIIDKLCITVKEPEYLPLEDVVLTKLLHVIFNEEEMIRTANHYPRDKNLLTMLN